MPPRLGVLDLLRADDRVRPWLDHVDRLGPTTVAWEIPGPTELGNRLAWCGVPDGVIPEIVALAPVIAADPDLQWLLDRSIQYLWSGMDRWEWPPQIPAWPHLPHDLHRWFFAVVYGTFLPLTLDLHRRRGVSVEISQASMSDIGRHVRIHEARHGMPGLSDPDWLWLHARGMIYQLGRLQFERAKLGGTTSRALQAQGFDYQHREPCLAVHIPSLMGPMPPDACDDAFALAREFFATRYPEETYRVAVCRSWLLDRQLAAFLPETSNIVQFQHRFRMAYVADQPEDHGTLEFVFRTPDKPLDTLPQRTTLERAVVRHLREGGHFYGAMGWIPLDPAPDASATS